MSEIAVHGKTHKLLNRVLFAAFCEDHPAALLPPNTLDALHAAAAATQRSVKYWPAFQRFFSELDKGSPPGSPHAYNAFNGGLFAPDAVLDAVKLPDSLFTKSLHYKPKRGSASKAIKGVFGFYEYDFSDELDVDTLGTIFEQSLKDLTAEGSVRGRGAVAISKREDTGVYYTPEAITAFLVSRALSGVMEPVRAKLMAKVKASKPTRRKFKYGRRALSVEDIRDLHFLEGQIEELKRISLHDPACGSGAFLVEAYRQFWAEYSSTNAAVGRLTGANPLFGLDKLILRKNLHGQDILSESVEISRLSLWLRTANKTQPLEKLDSTITVGDSLRDKRRTEFDIVVSNPPWGAKLDGWSDEEITAEFRDCGAEKDSYAVFVMQAERLLKPGGVLSFILPNSWLTVASYANFRRWLLRHFALMEIVNVWKAFPDVNHDACLLVARKRDSPADPSRNERVVVRRLARGASTDQKWQQLAEENWEDSFEASPSKWMNETDARFETIYPPTMCATLDRAFSRCSALEDVSSVTVGIQVYHQDKVSKDAIKNRIFHSNTKNGGDWYHFVTGNEVQRYFEAPGFEEFLHYNPLLCDKRPLPHYALPRILVQQIFWNRLSASYSDPGSPLLYLNTVFSVTEPKPPYTLPALLALLNSRLYSSAYERFANRLFGDKFPKVSRLDLARLPIPVLAPAQLKQFDAQGLALSREWQLLKREVQAFADYCDSKDSTGKLRTRLQEFWAVGRADVTSLLSEYGPGMSSREVTQFLTDWQAAHREAHRIWGNIAAAEAAVENLVQIVLRVPPEDYVEILKRSPAPTLRDALLPR